MHILPCTGFLMRGWLVLPNKERIIWQKPFGRPFMEVCAYIKCGQREAKHFSLALLYLWRGSQGSCMCKDKGKRKERYPASLPLPPPREHVHRQLIVPQDKLYKQTQSQAVIHYQQEMSSLVVSVLPPEKPFKRKKERAFMQQDKL